MTKKRFKTNHIILTIVLIISISFTACNFNKKTSSVEGNRGIVANVDDVNKEEIINYSDLFESYEVVPLETKRESLIGKIQSIRLLGDYIVISDFSGSRKVLLFDMKGNFIRQIGRQGKGPGEYVSVDAISTNEEKGEIAIFDGVTENVMIYNLEGGYINTISLKERSIILSAEIYNNKLFVACHYGGADEYLLYATDFNGDIKNKLIPNKNKERNYNITADSPSTVFHRTKDNLKFRELLDHIIYSVENDTIIPLITITSDDHKKNIDELMKERGDESDQISPFDLAKDALTGPTAYTEVAGISIVEYNNGGNVDLLFYDQNSGMVKNITRRNFKDDIFNIPISTNGYFYTSNENFVIAPLQGLLFEHFVKMVEDGDISSESNDLSKITIESNPVLIFYKIKPNATLSDQ